MEIGAQSYTVRKYCQNAEDLAATLEKISAIGYRYIQLSAIGPIDPAEVRRLCDLNGLRIVLTHNPANEFLEKPDELIGGTGCMDADMSDWDPCRTVIVHRTEYGSLLRTSARRRNAFVQPG